MSDIRIVTYGPSQNADTGREWVAWLVLPSGRLPVAFFAPSEIEAINKAQALWDSERPAREANIARREEGRRKAAETRAGKGEVYTAHKISEIED